MIDGLKSECADTVALLISFNSQTDFYIDETEQIIKGNTLFPISARLFYSFFEHSGTSYGDFLNSFKIDKRLSELLNITFLINQILEATGKKRVVLFVDEYSRAGLEPGYFRKFLSELGRLQTDGKVTVFYAGLRIEPFFDSTSWSGREISLIPLPPVSNSRYEEFLPKSMLTGKFKSVVSNGINGAPVERLYASDEALDAISRSLFQFTAGYPRFIEILRKNIRILSSPVTFPEFIDNFSRGMSRYPKPKLADSIANLALSLLAQAVPLYTYVATDEAPEDAEKDNKIEEILQEIQRASKAHFHNVKNPIFSKRLEELRSRYFNKVVLLDSYSTSATLFSRPIEIDDMNCIIPYLPPLIIHRLLKDSTPNDSLNWLEQLRQISILFHSMNSMAVATNLENRKSTEGDAYHKYNSAAFEKIIFRYEIMMRILRKDAPKYLPNTKDVMEFQYSAATIDNVYRSKPGINSFLADTLKSCKFDWTRKFVRVEGDLSVEVELKGANVDKKKKEKDKKPPDLPCYSDRENCEDILYIMKPGQQGFEAAWISKSRIGEHFLFLEQYKLPSSINRQGWGGIFRTINRCLEVATQQGWKNEHVVIIFKTVRPLQALHKDLLKELKGASLVLLCGEDFKSYVGPTMWDYVSAFDAIGPIAFAARKTKSTTTTTSADNISSTTTTTTPSTTEHNNQL